MEKKKSGSKYRKQKATDLLLSSATKCLKMDTFFKANLETSEPVSTTNELQASKANFSTGGQATSCSTPSPDIVVEEKLHNTPTKDTNETCMAACIDTRLPYPTDPHFLREKVMTPKLVRALLEIGPCQPGLSDDFSDFKKDDTGRHFSCTWYKQKLNNGMIVDRKWLVYSPEENSMYCFSCLLFAERTDCHYTKTWVEKGCTNFTKGLHKIDTHEKSTQHKKAENEVLMTKFRLLNDRTVVSDLMKAQNAEIQKNRNIIKKLIDVVLFLAKQNLPFRGHREYRGLGCDQENEGNFLELIKLLAKHDLLLEQHLLYCKRNESYLSHDIQNDLIHSLAAQVSLVIVDEVKLAKYYSIIVDSTIDVSHVDQLSLSVRYVTAKGDAVERFILFADLPGAGSEDFFNVIKENISKIGLSIENCFGQSYDGASTMSGIISGVQARVKEIAPNAIFIHCCAHNLNLILLDAVSSNTQTKLFFGTLESLYVFLSGSLPRLHILQQEQREQVEGVILTLKKLSDTRWASRKSAIQAVLHNVGPILSTLTRISDGEIANCTPKQHADATGLLTTVSTFEFILLLQLWNDILHKAFFLSSYLQNSRINLLTAQQLIEKFECDIKSMRYEDAFNEIEEKASNLARKYDLTSNYKTIRVRRSKIFFDDQANSVTLDNPRHKFKVDTYFVAVDTLIQRTSDRFQQFKTVCSKFSALDPVHFFDTNYDSKERLQILANNYAKELSSVTDLIDEYESFKHILSDILKEKMHFAKDLNINNVLSFLIINDMSHLYPNLSTMYKLYLTLPISSAGAERSFSRLKLIKTYLRNTMHEQRLSDLSLLSIEREIATNLEYKKVISYFSEMKPRRKKF